jgi:pimeloyl-ACP methyl ester carboxylesterase
MTDFLLIHGAWHGAWCWDRLIPALTALGHRASAIDLPGHGADPTPRETVTLAAYGAAVADALRAAPGPVVLVGHSMGGMAISAGAALVPDKVSALVYLTAFLPGDGRSLMSYEGDNPDPRVPPALVPDGAVATVRPEMVRDAFLSRHDEALHHLRRHHRLGAAQGRQPGRADHRGRAGREHAGGLRGRRQHRPLPCAQRRRDARPPTPRSSPG